MESIAGQRGEEEEGLCLCELPEKSQQPLWQPAPLLTSRRDQELELGA